MSKAIKHSKNISGFSLVELLVTVSIIAIVALAGASLAQVADKSTQYADRKQEFQALSQMIMEHLKNGESCISALGGQAIAGVNPNAYAGNGNAYGRNNQQRVLRNGQERLLAITIDGLQVGPTMANDVLDPTDPNPLNRQILPRRLQINNLSISNARLLNNDGTNSQYLVSVNLQAEEIGGMAFREQMIGMTTITANNTSNAIVACEAMPADAMKRVCESDSGMGCVWDPNSQPNCRCLRSQVLCAAPGYYPVSFENGVPNCRPLGGKTCPAGEFLVGLGIDQVICGPVPNSCPAGSSLTGVGNAIPGLAKCKCDVAGQNYVNGACQNPPTPTPTPTTPTPTPTPSGSTPTPTPSGGTGPVWEMAGDLDTSFPQCQTGQYGPNSPPCSTAQLGQKCWQGGGGGGDIGLGSGPMPGTYECRIPASVNMLCGFGTPEGNYYQHGGCPPTSTARCAGGTGVCQAIKAPPGAFVTMDILGGDTRCLAIAEQGTIQPSIVCQSGFVNCPASVLDPITCQ